MLPRCCCSCCCCCCSLPADVQLPGGLQSTTFNGYQKTMQATGGVLRGNKGPLLLAAARLARLNTVTALLPRVLSLWSIGMLQANRALVCTMPELSGSLQQLFLGRLPPLPALLGGCDGRLFLVWRSSQRAPLGEAAEIVQGTLEVLAELHKHGIVFRDVKRRWNMSCDAHVCALLQLCSTHATECVHLPCVFMPVCICL